MTGNFDVRPGALAATVLVALAAGLAAASASRAASSDWVRNDQAELRLISAADATGDDAAVQLGLQFRLAPHWKIYWRSPGDAGLPPMVDWSASDNVAEVATDWPVPLRFTVFGLETFGYEGEVVLPLRVRLTRPGEPLTARAHLRYLVCDPTICVPAEANLALDLPKGPAAPSAEAALLQYFVGAVPGDGKAAGLNLLSVRAMQQDGAPALVAEAEAEPPFAKPDLIVEGPQAYRFARPRVELSPDGRHARLTVAVEAESGAPALAGLPLTFTLFDGGRALEAKLSPSGRPPVGIGALVSMLGLALLGGLILNIMPCVLPVLSLKLLGVVGQGGRQRAHIRASFLASAAGILFSFLVLAAALIGLKAGGAAIGWGIQFQQPLFLAALALVLVLFSANMFGFFEMPLPAALAGLGVPQSGGARHGLAAAFATGAFATLLATPCSAPFLGTAIGFALGRGPAEILPIFAALGLGLALPWLAVAAVPGLAQRLPRPGRWMVWLKAALGLALLATAAWLLSILAIEVSPGAAVLVAALLAAILLALAVYRLVRRAWRLAAAIVALLAAAVLLLPSRMPLQAWTASPPAAGAGSWQAFDEAAIPGLVAAGRIVFVDVTADWCLTCQANKKLVLDQAAIRSRLEAPGVNLMKADWTRPDPVIARYLAGFDRYGIPFNVVYGPRAPAGIVLPEVLTPGAVLSALARAGG